MDEKSENLSVFDAEWKKQRVLDLLDKALVPGDIRRLKSYLSPECEIVFPGFRAHGHEGADQLLELIEQAFEGCPTKSYDLWICDKYSVCVHGHLYGRMKDGHVMDGTRYTDTFVFDPEGLVNGWYVYNDLAVKVG